MRKIIESIEDLRKCRKSDDIQKAPHRVHDAVLLGDWEETQKIPVEQLRKWTNDAEQLDGLILKGYEMRWDVTNENGERYEKTAFDKFIQEYFVDRKLNMPVDINHDGYYNWLAFCGRVLYIETNSVGFYFVVYVPKTYRYYDDLHSMLQNGIIQGFSKEGWATEWDAVWNEDGTFNYEIIHEMKVLSVSLVCTPANGIAFEKMQEIRNEIIFKAQAQKQNNLKREDF